MLFSFRERWDKLDNKIHLLKNNDNRDWSDVEWIQEFYDFLQGVEPDGICFARGKVPKLSPKKAFSIIWYLQEHFPIFPDHIEPCSNCGCIYDTYSEGLYWETKNKFFCGNCEYLVPEHYDRGKR